MATKLQKSRTRKLLDQLKAWCSEEWGRQSEAAREIGTDRYTINHWFAGRHKHISEQILSVMEFLKKARRRSAPKQGTKTV